jgi:hypothetical protein
VEQSSTATQPGFLPPRLILSTERTMKCPMCDKAELIHPAGPEWLQCPACKVFGSVALFVKIMELLSLTCKSHSQQ